jgi:hypothetical protein
VAPTRRRRSTRAQLRPWRHRPGSARRAPAEDHAMASGLCDCTDEGIAWRRLHGGGLSDEVAPLPPRPPFLLPLSLALIEAWSH